MICKRRETIWLWMMRQKYKGPNNLLLNLKEKEIRTQSSLKNLSKDNVVAKIKISGSKTLEVVKIISIEEETKQRIIIENSATIETIMGAIKSSMQEKTKRKMMKSNSPQMVLIDRNHLEAIEEVHIEEEITIKELNVRRRIPILDHLMHLKLTIHSNRDLELIMKRITIKDH